MAGWWAETHTPVLGATLHITGGTPTIVMSSTRIIIPAPATLIITRSAPASLGLITRPGAAALTTSRGTPNVQIGKTVTPTGASRTLTGGTPTVTVSNKQVVTPTGAALNITPGTPTIPGRAKPLIAGTNTAAANTVPIPAHQVGDLILVYAFARNNVTPPTIPAAAGTVPAWSQVTVGPGSGICSGRTVIFTATATNHTSGTWSGATGMIAAVIRGQVATPIGGAASDGGSTLDCTAPAVTLSDPAGYSLIINLFGARSGSAAVTWGAAPAGYTQQASDSSGCVCMDVKTITTTDGAVTQTRTGATPGYDSHTLEILAPQTAGSPSDPVPTGVPGTWQLAFNDDFNGTTLNTTKWATNWYSGTNNVTSSTANIAVSGSNLVLTLSDANTGAIVTTKPGGSTTGFKVGAECVWEARILFPSDGTHIYNWPAFWVLNDDAGDVTCEIDIAEPWDGVMQTNYHCSGSNPSHSYSAYTDGNFHIWTLRRTTTQMLFYVDGVLVYTLAKAGADNGHPQYVIINVGRMTSNLYNAFGGASQVKVDYVRAWTPA